MKEIFDLPLYLRDRVQNKSIYNNLFYFKKNNGIDWIKGQNFGDYLSLIIVGLIANILGLQKKKQILKNRLLCCGSILHFAINGDTIWGSGVNGKIPTKRHTFTELDVRMVRGPLTKKFLEKKGVFVPEILGDPALLLPILLRKHLRHPIKNRVIFIPNLNDLKLYFNKIAKNITLVSPLIYWEKVLSNILSSELVITSSLHALIVSEAFRVPTRFITPIGGETLFKYNDYLLSTDRGLIKESQNFTDRITAKSGMLMNDGYFNTKEMLKTFPVDIFK